MYFTVIVLALTTLTPCYLYGMCEKSYIISIMASYFRSVPYKPNQNIPYKLSRSKLELFMQCKRCFWLDVRLKISRPSSPPFNINKAIDELFKKEFDYYRNLKEPHPLMTEAGIDAVPYKHKDLNKWRTALGNNVGISIIHKPTNLYIYGAIDDVWQSPDGQLIIVDYKATAKEQPVRALGPKGNWQDMYRRQMEIYQWLFKQNNFDVSKTGYFVYATGSWAHDKFDNVVNFETHIFGYSGDISWVEPTIYDMKQVMDSDEIPEVGRQVMDQNKPCEFCDYAKQRTEITLKALKKLTKN